jgi:aminopeptidase N
VHAMAKDAESELSPAERIMLPSDVWASIRVGREKIGDYLAVAEGLRTDRSRPVLGPLMEQLDFIGRYLVNDADRDSYREWVRRLFTPTAADVGWQSKPGEDADREGLRADLLRTLGTTARDPEIEALARRLADRALDDPSSVNHALARAAFVVAARRGDEAFYNRIKERLKTAKTPEEVIMYQQSLTQFADPVLFEKTLEFAISPEVRSQDTALLLSFAMQNPDGEKPAWEFVRSHWEKIRSLGEELAGIYIVGSAGSFCDASLRDQLQDFFATHHDPTSERTLKQSAERINDCVDLKAQQGGQLSGWLQQHSSSIGGQ